MYYRILFLIGSLTMDISSFFSIWDFNFADQAFKSGQLQFFVSKMGLLEVVQENLDDGEQNVLLGFVPHKKLNNCYQSFFGFRASTLNARRLYLANYSFSYQKMGLWKLFRKTSTMESKMYYWVLFLIRSLTIVISRFLDLGPQL